MDPVDAGEHEQLQLQTGCSSDTSEEWRFDQKTGEVSATPQLGVSALGIEATREEQMPRCREKSFSSSRDGLSRLSGSFSG